MEASETSISNSTRTFKKILETLFNFPSAVLISGKWKTGKTDFFLKLAEILLKMKLVDEVATNIYTEDAFQYVCDLPTLKYWLHRNDKTKLYGLDEANVHLPSRRAMSNKSVEIITLLPETSKARARLCIIGQDFSSVDSEYRKATWIRGYFEKIDLKTVRVDSPLLPRPYEFTDFPKTSIKFNPYLSAPFGTKATETPFIDNEDMAKYYKWANGTPWREQFKDPKQANRFYRKMAKQLIAMYSPIDIHSVEGTTKEKSQYKE